MIFKPDLVSFLTLIVLIFPFSLFSKNIISSKDSGQDTLLLPPKNIELTEDERKTIRKNNTAKFSFFMRKKSRRFILLMNLCRTNGPLFVKYAGINYGDEFAGKKIITQFARKKPNDDIPLLRPSVGLYLTSAVHSFFTGIKGTEGHKSLDLRILLFMNFNTLLPGVTRGENCEYGGKNEIESLVNLLGSPAHRANILRRNFMRVGVSRFLHLRYGTNTVSAFSGPKLVDFIFRHRQAKLAK